MSNNQDARPFVDLKKDAGEFRAKFDEDIAECMNFLDAKITALICDPDSLGSTCIRPNTAAEFSKSKYDIYISVKKLVMQKEREWTGYISEMKKLFLENVEIFLAGTKLEVKLPSAEFQSSVGPRKSPGNRKSTSVASSFMSSFTRNIPGLSAPRQSQEASSNLLEGTSKVEDAAVFGRRGRYSLKLPPFSLSDHKDSSSADSEDGAVGGEGAAEIAMDVGNIRYHTTAKSSPKTRNSSSSDLNTSQSSLRHRSSLNKSDLDTLEVKLKDLRILVPKINTASYELVNGNAISNSDENAIGEEAEFVKVPVPSKGRRGRQSAKNKVQNSTVNGNYTNNSDENTVSEEVEIDEVLVPSKGRKGRQAAKKKVDNSAAQENYTNISDENAVAEVEMDVASVSSRGRRGRQTAKKKVDMPAAQENYTSNSDENVVAEEVETDDVPVPTKGRRGRQAARKKVDNSAATLQKTGGSDEDIVKESETTSHQVPSKGRRGRLAAKSAVDTTTAMLQITSNNIHEMEVIQESETRSNQILTKGRRGRQTVKNKDTNSSVLLPVSQMIEDTNTTAKKEPLAEVETSVAYEGMSALPKKSENASDKSVVAKAPARGRRAAKTVIEEESSEEDIVPDPVPAQPTPRRKTLLPNLKNALGSDIVPGISMTYKSKRKTMSAVSEFEAAAPSKRLKLGSKRDVKDVSSQDKDDTVSDNLLESDENYSEWMPLKSIDGKIPTRPAIYELKVWRAKKPAYIGECESLRQKLTLYKLRQNSGHKHLDKFVDRNYNDLQVRFEVVESLSNAKEEVKNRIKAFVTQNKTTPAYN